VRRRRWENGARGPRASRTVIRARANLSGGWKPRLSFILARPPPPQSDGGIVYGSSPNLGGLSAAARLAGRLRPKRRVLWGCCLLCCFLLDRAGHAVRAGFCSRRGSPTVVLDGTMVQGTPAGSNIAPDPRDLGAFTKVVIPASGEAAASATTHSRGAAWPARIVGEARHSPFVL